MHANFRQIVQEKSVILLAVALLITVLSVENLLIAFIVAGQAHFLITYIYQRRAGKITPTYIALYIPCAIACFWLATTLSLNWLIVLTGSLFAIHFFYDEIRLLARNNVEISAFALLAPILLFSALIFERHAGIDLMLPLGLVLGCIFFYHVFVPRLRSVLFSAPVVYVQLASLYILMLYLFGIPASPIILFGTIVLYHYGTWYVHFFIRLYNDTSRLRKYLKDVIICNLVVVGLYAIYVNYAVEPLAYLFEPRYFYAWTLLHIVFSSQDLFKLVVHKTTSFRNTPQDRELVTGNKSI